MNDLVSIIITLYKSEKYIEKCLNSVLNQTYKNIEVIIVNDGSPDSSIDICKNYKKRDKRIKVYNMKHKGLSSARNTGIKMHNGSYITFVDPDDYIEEDYVEKLYKAIIKYKVDMVECSFYFEYPNECYIRYSITDNKIKKFKKMDAIKDYLLNDHFYTMTWGKLYNSKLFNNISFPEYSNIDDYATTYKILDEGNSFLYIDDVLYHYVQKGNGIIGGITHKSIREMFDMQKEKIEYLSKYDIDKELIYNQIYFCKWIYNLVFIKDYKEFYDEHIEYYKEIKKLYKKNKKYIINILKLYPKDKYKEELKSYKLFFFSLKRYGMKIVSNFR